MMRLDNTSFSPFLNELYKNNIIINVKKINNFLQFSLVPAMFVLQKTPKNNMQVLWAATITNKPVKSWTD